MNFGKYSSKYRMMGWRSLGDDLGVEILDGMSHSNNTKFRRVLNIVVVEFVARSSVVMVKKWKIIKNQ